MTIKCCYGCVAPKRYLGCHDHCPDYAKEKAQLEKDTAAKAVQQGITNQKYDGVYRAQRRKGKK